jgi:Sec-independent protein translocase protein TatA
LLSPADLLVAFVAGLLLFGPEGLPQVARKAGKIVRELQNTSQAFVREMERAADIPEPEANRHEIDPELEAGPEHFSEPAAGEAPPKSSGSNESR